MTDAELRERMKQTLAGWREVDAFCEAERDERLRNTDTATSLRRLNSLFNSAVHLHPPQPGSGFVESCEILSRSRA